MDFFTFSSNYSVFSLIPILPCPFVSTSSINIQDDCRPDRTIIFIVFSECCYREAIVIKTAVSFYDVNKIRHRNTGRPQLSPTSGAAILADISTFTDSLFSRNGSVTIDLRDRRCFIIAASVFFSCRRFYRSLVSFVQFDFDFVQRVEKPVSCNCRSEQ